MTSIETNVATLDEACRVLSDGQDADRCREARRFICRADSSTEAMERIVDLERFDHWDDADEIAAFKRASDAVFGDGWPQSLEEHEALMAEGSR